MIRLELTLTARKDLLAATIMELVDPETSVTEDEAAVCAELRKLLEDAVTAERDKRNKKEDKNGDNNNN